MNTGIMINFFQVPIYTQERSIAINYNLPGRLYSSTNGGAAPPKQPQERCDLCRSFSLMSLAGGRKYKHHSTLTDLHNSTLNGCDFCNLIWHCITKTTSEDALANVMKMENQQITIVPNEINMRIMPALGNHSAFDELWIHVGEEGEGSIWGRVELFTSRGSQMSRFFLGRDVTPCSSSRENFDDIGGWIDACYKHPSCPSSSDTPLPTRVLDVGSNDSTISRLAITNGQTGKYICLSYCWGTSPGLSTTYDLLDTHLKGIPDEKLPATLRDAVHITRQLNFRCLWIDALCIVQRRPEIVNDEEAIADWQEQSSKMADIYGNAFLTIIAADANDKSQGCFTPRVIDPSICELPLDETSASGVLARLCNGGHPNGQKAPVDARAWTFQEAILSQRNLVYGKEITYQCKTCTFWERKQSPSSFPEPGTMWATRLSLFAQPVKKVTKFIHGNKDGDLSSLKRTESLDTVRDHTIVQWYYSLEFNFCGRLLTNEMDILPALSGVAHRIQPIIGGAYHAGIWEVHLPEGLLWKPRNVLPASRGKWLTRPASYRAPSWSWAALKGQVYYGISHRQLKCSGKEKAKFPCRLLEVKTELVGPVYDPMGQVSGGWIKVYAPVKDATLVSTSVNTFKNEWTDSKGVLYRFEMKENENLLVDKGELDYSDAKAVGAIGHLDTTDPWLEDLRCALLTVKEGLMLVRVKESLDEFRRIGIFKLQKADWFDNCEIECLTIV